MQKCKNAKDILYSADIAHDITFAFLHFLCKTFSSKSCNTFDGGTITFKDLCISGTLF